MERSTNIDGEEGNISKGNNIFVPDSLRSPLPGAALPPVRLTAHTPAKLWRGNTVSLCFSLINHSKNFSVGVVGVELGLTP